MLILFPLIELHLLIDIGTVSLLHLLVSADLLQSDVQEHIQHPHKLCKDEANHVEEETLAVVEYKQRRLQTRLGPQFGANFRFKYRYVHDQANEHQKA